MSHSSIRNRRGQGIVLLAAIVVLGIPAQAQAHNVDVSVALAAPATVKNGDAFAYSYTVTNPSTSYDATHVVLTDTLPRWARSSRHRRDAPRTAASVTCPIGDHPEEAQRHAGGEHRERAGPGSGDQGRPDAQHRDGHQRLGDQQRQQLRLGRHRSDARWPTCRSSRRPRRTRSWRATPSITSSRSTTPDPMRRQASSIALHAPRRHPLRLLGRLHRRRRRGHVRGRPGRRRPDADPDHQPAG